VIFQEGKLTPDELKAIVAKINSVIDDMEQPYEHSEYPIEMKLMSRS
jgi:hypothetical protein